MLRRVWWQCGCLMLEHKSRRSQSRREVWQAHNEFSGEPRLKFCSVFLKWSDLYLIYHQFSYSLQQLFSLTVLQCKSCPLSFLLHNRHPIAPYYLHFVSSKGTSAAKTVSARLLNTKSVCWSWKQSAGSLISYIIKKQSLLHWETLGFCLISIYSIFIQTTFWSRTLKATKTRTPVIPK